MSVDISANLVTRSAEGNKVFDFLPGTEDLGVNLSSRSLGRVVALLGFEWDGEDFGHADVLDVRDALAAVQTPRGDDADSALLRQYLGDLFILVEAAHVRSSVGVITWG